MNNLASQNGSNDIKVRNYGTVSNLIISVGEARKIIGVDAKGRTDDEVAKEVLELTDLAQKLLNTSILPNKTV
jgi:hypothetical protein